jgi:prevent-host-death family protein
MSDHIKRRSGGASKRESVGVRELKTHAARIVRAVREEHASYIVTHRGNAVGVILPLTPGAAPPAAEAPGDDPWSTFLTAGRRLAQGFRPGMSGTQALSESRR